MAESAVDVLLPVRGPAPHLRACLASLNAQSMSAWRLVAVVDGRDVEVEHTLRDVISPARLHVILFEENRGLVPALNAGLEACSAPFIARMDADDICHPNRFERQVTWLQEHPEYAVLGASAALIDAAGRPLERHIGAEQEAHEVAAALIWRNQLVHPSVMIRRRMLGTLRYDAAAERREDYELWLRLARVGNLANLSQVLIDYRVSEGQTSAQRVSWSSLRRVHRSRVELARELGLGTLKAHAAGVVWGVAQTSFYRNYVGRLRGVS